MIDLNKQLESWLKAGIISTEQADQMRLSVERSSDGPAQGGGTGRIPIIAEILGYVGAALAIWAVVFLVSEFWANLTDVAQAALFALVSLGLFVAGRVPLESEEPALRRLSSVLWTASVLALGGALYITFDPISGLSVEATWALLGATCAVVGGLMLWRQRMPAQHVVLFAAVMTTIMASISLRGEPEAFVFGFVAWGIGLAWILLTRAGLLEPFGTGMILGAISMLYGAQMSLFDGDGETFGVLLGLLTAALFATAGVVLKEKLTIVLGGIGIFWFVPQAMFHFFGETFGGMFGLLVSGLAILALAIWFTRHREAL